MGGSDTFDRIAARFYEEVARDEVLRPMYPGKISAPRNSDCVFLEQYWGGPARTPISAAIRV